MARGVNVVNAGVSGGELTQVGYYGTFTGLQRLQQVLAEPGITDVVLSLGTNDLAGHVQLSTLFNGYREAALLAHQHGVQLWITTIAPRGDIRWSGALEVARRRLNAMFRGGFLQTIGAHLDRPGRGGARSTAYRTARSGR